MMRIVRVALVVALVALAGCQEQTGPELQQSPSMVTDGALHALTWAAPRTFTVTAANASELGPQTAEGAATLGTNAISFWAYANRDNVVEVHYVDASGTATLPFVRFRVPQGSLWKRPDGSYFGSADSVLISLALDEGKLRVDMEPSGLVFKPWIPATLRIWYGGANPDYNADGVVDAADAAIEADLLDVWTQAASGFPWERLFAQQSVSERWFWTPVFHFSGFEVSY